MYRIVERNQVSDELNSLHLCYIQSIPETVLDYTPEAKSFMASDYGIELKRLRDEAMEKELREKGSCRFPYDEYFRNTPMHQVPNPEYDADSRTHYAYFTPRPLDKQWGDDWNDYNYSSEMPYDRMDDGEVEIIKIPFKFDEDYMNLPRETYSVQVINERAVAWIHDERHHCSLLAGATPKEFIEFLEKGD